MQDKGVKIVMKIGIISDIHSNIIALEEVLKRFEIEKVDKIICLGDVIGIGPYPEKCVQKLIEKQNDIISYLNGNHEKYLIGGIPKTNHNEKNERILTEEEINTHKWNHNRLNEKQIKFIKTLKYKDIINIENIKIVVEHYPMDLQGNYKKYYSFPSEDILEDLFEERDARIFLFGHTHSPYYKVVNSKYYINPGSLGCPSKTGCASVGILKVAKEEISYENIQVEYDVNKVIRDIRKLNYPLNDFMIKKFYHK